MGKLTNCARIDSLCCKASVNPRVSTVATVYTGKQGQPDVVCLAMQWRQLTNDAFANSPLGF